LIGGFQQVVLISIAVLADGADGAAIRAEVSRRLGRAVASGPIHITLQRLEQMHFISSVPLPHRRRVDGRGPRRYRVEAAGQKALSMARVVTDRIWEGVD
jgi:PadR family transcriptional regulator, regulatory protein PadR